MKKTASHLEKKTITIYTPHHIRGSFILKVLNCHEAHHALCLRVESRPEAKVALVQLIEARLFKGLWIHYLAQLCGHMHCSPVDLPLWKVKCVFVYTRSRVVQYITFAIAQSSKMIWVLEYMKFDFSQSLQSRIENHKVSAFKCFPQTQPR